MLWGVFSPQKSGGTLRLGLFQVCTGGFLLLCLADTFNKSFRLKSAYIYVKDVVFYFSRKFEISFQIQTNDTRLLQLNIFYTSISDFEDSAVAFAQIYKLYIKRVKHVIIILSAIRLALRCFSLPIIFLATY